VHPDPYTRRHVQILALDAMWRGDRREQMVGAECRVLGTSQFRQENHELVAAETADGIRPAHSSHQPGRDRPQDLVANCMAPVIVDLLEAVQVYEQHRQQAPAATRRGDRPVEPIGQQQPVGQAGEDVVLRQVGHAQRQGASRAHVVEHDHRADHSSMPVMHGGGSVFDCGLAPIAADQQAVLAYAGVGVASHRQCQRITNGLAGVRVDDLHHFLQRPAGRLRRRPAGHALGDRIHVGDPAGQIGAEHGVPDRVEHDLRALLCPAQCRDVGTRSAERHGRCATSQWFSGACHSSAHPDASGSHCPCAGGHRRIAAPGTSLADRGPPYRRRRGLGSLFVHGMTARP